MSTPAGHGGRSLPRYLTSFIGRGREIEEISELLARHDVRLLTLLGPGGAGKTRLTVETINALGENAWDEIWFVPLVTVRDPSLVIPAIAQTLGLRMVSGRPVDEAIVHFLRDKRALLVIDNLEHVIDAASELGRLLAACPRTTMLVTSRVALRISGEHLMVIHPLATPGGGNIPLDQLREIDSVQLFLQRASASDRAFTLTPVNAAAIARICQRLDGLPLALELAAARCSLLSPTALDTLLEDGSGLLSDGPRDVPERHRSLHEAIAWSYDLLPEQEQTVFRRLAVFSGGFSLEAAEAIVDLPADMLSAIASLVSKSLIVPAPTHGPEPRFTMLETIREFGLDQLSAKGEALSTRDRHASYFLQEAIESEYAWCMFLPDGFHWLNRLVNDQSNMRAALTWLYSNDNITQCLRLAGALSSLWVLQGLLDEGQIWLDRLLADPRADDDAIRANGLATLSWISNQQNRMDRAFDLAEEVIAMSRKVDLPLDAIRGHVLSGVAALALHRYDIARQRHTESIALMTALDEPDWLKNFIQNEMVSLGFVELMQGSIDAAEVRFREAWKFDVDRGYEPGTSFLYGNAVFSGLSRVARAKGDAAGALHFAQQLLRPTHRYANANFAIHAICDIAGALAALGHFVQAARLFGASQALHESTGQDFNETFDVQRAAGLPEPWAREGSSCGTTERLRDALTPRAIPQLPSAITIEALNESWAEGRALSLDEAVAEALAATAEPAPRPDQGAADGLTPREIEVLRLVAEGHSNRAIADTLSLSERTVEHHVTHILAKLDLDSRTAAATFAVRQGLL